jgi:hypothetical protein
VLRSRCLTGHAYRDKKVVGVFVRFSCAASAALKYFYLMDDYYSGNVKLNIALAQFQSGYINTITLKWAFYKNNYGLVIVLKLDSNCWINIKVSLQMQKKKICSGRTPNSKHLQWYRRYRWKTAYRSRNGWTLIIMRIPVKVMMSNYLSYVPVGVVFRRRYV